MVLLEVAPPILHCAMQMSVIAGNVGFELNFIRPQPSILPLSHFSLIIFPTVIRFFSRQLVLILGRGFNSLPVYIFR